MKAYAWGLPECLRSVKEGGERSQSMTIKRGEGLDPFILDVLKDFGEDLQEKFLRKYKGLSGQPGAAGFEADHDLLAPHQKIMAKLSQIETLPEAHLNKLAREARGELRIIESHVEDMKTEWGRIFRTSNSKSAQDRILDVRRKFESGPDVPHLSHLCDLSEIRASYAYRLGTPSFAVNMALDVLCRIKARESGGITSSREFAELVTIPKIAVRTLSALRPDV